MRRRRIIISVDDLMGLLKDYCPADDIPSDTMPERLLLRPAEQGRLGILAESRFWPVGAPALEVKFELRRFHSL